MNEMIGSMPKHDGAAVIASKSGEKTGLDAGAKRLLDGKPFRYMSITDSELEGVVTIDTEGASFASGISSGYSRLNDADANACLTPEGNQPDNIGTAECSEEDEYLKVMESVIFTLRETLSVCFASASALFHELEDQKKTETLPYLAMMKHNHYKLLQLTRNIESYLMAGRGPGYTDTGLIELNYLCTNLVGTVASLFYKSGIDFLFISQCEDAVISADYIIFEHMLLCLFCDSIRLISGGGDIILAFSKNDGNSMLNITACGRENGTVNRNNMENSGNKPVEAFGIFGGTDLGTASAMRIVEHYNGNMFINMQENGRRTIGVALPETDADKSSAQPQAGIYSEVAMNRVLAGLADVLDYTHFMGLYEA